MCVTTLVVLRNYGKVKSINNQVNEMDLAAVGHNWGVI